MSVMKLDSPNNAELKTMLCLCVYRAVCVCVCVQMDARVRTNVHTSQSSGSAESSSQTAVPSAGVGTAILKSNFSSSKSKPRRFLPCSTRTFTSPSHLVTVTVPSKTLCCSSSSRIVWLPTLEKSRSSLHRWRDDGEYVLEEKTKEKEKEKEKRKRKRKEREREKYHDQFPEIAFHVDILNTPKSRKTRRRGKQSARGGEGKKTKRKKIICRHSTRSASRRAAAACSQRMQGDVFY